MRPNQPSLPPIITSYNGLESVPKAKAYPVKTYRDLVELVAQLSFLNKDNLLFFRGQTQDIRNKVGASTFYPSIYRGEILLQHEVNYRFRLLNTASRQLVDLFSRNKIEGYKDVKQKRYIQWSILQHYGVCGTPLLDFTHSLRVACSFAQYENNDKNAFVYVFGLPYLSNRISINSEHDIVNIRLLSICPPNALRPYFQEGYLAGTTDIENDYDSKSELDFNNRLIAKFIIPNTQQFWGPGLKKIPIEMLFPKHDTVEELCRSISFSAPKELHPGTIGDFISNWKQLEVSIIKLAQIQNNRVFSVREAIQRLYVSEIINKQQVLQLEGLRKFRNVLIHEETPIDVSTVNKNVQIIKDYLQIIKADYPNN